MRSELLAEVTGLRKQVDIEEDAACGRIIKTSYFDSDNNLVRRDIHVEVSPEAMAAMLKAHVQGQ
jgi:hypothetical protein